jgi:hypothetical protein
MRIIEKCMSASRKNTRTHKQSGAGVEARSHPDADKHLGYTSVVAEGIKSHFRQNSEHMDTHLLWVVLTR